MLQAPPHFFTKRSSFSCSDWWAAWLGPRPPSLWVRWSSSDSPPRIGILPCVNYSILLSFPVGVVLWSEHDRIYISCVYSSVGCMYWKDCLGVWCGSPVFLSILCLFLVSPFFSSQHHNMADVVCCLCCLPPSVASYVPACTSVTAWTRHCVRPLVTSQQRSTNDELN